MDLDARTLEALDWPAVLTALAEHAHTPMGKRAAVRVRALGTLAEVRAAHDAIDEAQALLEAAVDVPVGAVGDVGPSVKRCEKGEVLDVVELRAVGQALDALRRLAWVLQARGDLVPVLAGMASGILIDDSVADELLAAFDPLGQLSAQTYPELGELRRRIQDLHAAIRTTLDELVSGDELADVLQDRYVTQRSDRYVLPIKAHAKRWNIGIVHGTSGSGATVYVEPRQVVELNNRLRLAEGALLAEERRILAALSRMVGAIAAPVADALALATEIDLVVARHGLARRLLATRPRVGEDGVVALQRGRHPVLALRGVAVVGNDLRLASDAPALVLTGPNAGGKTVSLKTIGLCALLVRAGCFVPADEGSRVDLFPRILATIGDAQTVHDDLSSFSGHLLQQGVILDTASPGTLVLLDELASGTDPAQGAALGQAILEALLDRGARVVVTTHYARLKALAATDPRFAVAAVEHAAGRPTYRVVPGTSGESHAFELARAMGIADGLVDRAESLLDGGERSLAASLEALEKAKVDALVEAERARVEAESLEARAAALARREAEVQVRAKELEEQAAAAFVDRLKRAERAISEVVAQLQRSPSHKGVAAARATLSSLGALLPSGLGPAEPVEPAPLAVGDRVRLDKVGVVGRVISVGDALQVRSNTGLTLRVDVQDVTRLGGAPAAPPAPRRKKPKNKASTGRQVALDQAVRIPGNTLDLRGMRVDEGLDAAAAFLDKATVAGHDAVFLLHGHGTGAMKEALRTWLRSASEVRSWAPANADQGGDAFTIAVPA